MREPIENEYFNWLCTKALSPYSKSYFDLMQILHRTEFVWIVSGDKNRKQDGLELRDYFLNETELEKEFEWFNEPCSIFEMLLSFAGRASFQTDDPVRECFMDFLTNLNLDEYRRVTDSDIFVIEEILFAFVWRTYEYSGHNGGLFPLDDPKEDQRKVELWYQYFAWLDERDYM